MPPLLRATGHDRAQLVVVDLLAAEVLVVLDLPVGHLQRAQLRAVLAVTTLMRAR